MRLSRFVFLFSILALLAGLLPAGAVESVRVPPDGSAIDLTRWAENYSNQGDRIQVSTAPGSDGIVRRIEVHAREQGAHPSWIVFALTNDTDEQMERLIVAPHFRLVGSGVIWPDLGSERIAEITASQGIAPEKEDVADADVFRLTLDPGATVTYVAELKTPKLPQLYLWEPDAYKDKNTSLTLYKGIVIGIAGLLALFLTIVFVVKGAVIFPAAAALAWAVLAYICIDFGFWSKVFGTETNADRIWRAGAETVLSATLVVFLFAYLNLSRWHVRASHVAGIWLLFLLALAGLAVYDAPVAAGVARISLATIAAVGFILVLYLATHGVERAVMLIPTWLLLVVWVCAAGFTVNGSLDQRPRLAGPARRPGAAGDADRLHHHAERLRLRRRRPWRHHRRRAQGPGADRLQRHHLRLGRLAATRSSSARRSRTSSACGAANWKGRRRHGWACCIRSSATAIAPASTPCSSRGAAGSARISASTPPTAIISGSGCAPAPWSGPRATWCGWSARWPTSPTRRTRSSACCTTRSMTI